MNALQAREALKNLSQDELCTVQNAVTYDLSLDAVDRVAALDLIGQEQAIRRNEGWERKAERFWNRHGRTIGAVAVGALLGDWIGD